jgi:tetratricopeptide (TPR) repeat protein
VSLRAPPGRSADLEAVSSILDAPFGVALITGEPGSGKAELAAAWRATAATRGFLCGAVRVSGVGEGGPLDPLVDALMGSLSGFEGRHGALKALGTIPAPERVRVGSLAGHLAPSPSDTSALAFAWERLRLDQVRGQECLAGAARTIAATRPLGLVLRGIDHGSPLLLEYLEYILGVAAERPLSILLTAESGARDEALEGRLRAACEYAGSRFVTVDLGPLDRVFMEETLASRYPGGGISDIVQGRILDAAQGNAGLLGEVCLRLEDAGVLYQSAGQWYSTPEIEWPLPTDPEGVRLAPVMELESGDFDLLEFLAALGGPVPDGLLSDKDVLDYLGLAERPCRKSVVTLEERGILEVVEGGYRFRDEALQAAIHQAAGGVRQRDLAMLAGALGRLPGAPGVRVAHLLAEMGALADAALAYREAAADAEEAGAWRSAAQALARARELDAEAEVEASLEERIDRHRREGNAWHVAAAFDKAVDAYSHALVPAELLDLHGRVAGLLCRRGSCYLEQGLLAAAREDFDAAMEAAEATGSRKAVRLAALGSMRVALAEGDTGAAMEAREIAGQEADGAERWLRLAEVLAKANGPEGPELADKLLDDLAVAGVGPVVTGIAQVALAAARRQEDPRRSLDLARQGVETARKAGDSRTLARGLEVLAGVGPGAGAPPEETRAAWMELARLAARLGLDDLQLVACLEVGELLVGEESWERAAELLGRASRLGARLNLAASEAHAQQLLGQANLARGQLYEAQSDFEAAERLAVDSGDQRGAARARRGLGQVYARQRKKERARECLAQARDAFEDLGETAEVASCTALLEELA